ncbi:MAG: TRASH domain-containing protein [Sphingobacteriales bacterium]|nr:TRASH domain-containing protein [Sphingobacteriales bacterium]
MGTYRAIRRTYVECCVTCKSQTDFVNRRW